MTKKILTNLDVSNTITAAGDITTNGWLYSNASGGDEGGQIVLAKPVTNTSLSSSIVIDIFQNRLRFFEYGGTNRGYYLDLTAAAGAAGTNLASGTTGAMNYDQQQSGKVSGVSASGVTIVSRSFTTNGYPVQVLVTGDAENSTAGAWVKLQLYRDSTPIGKIIHVESSAASENVPFALTVIDTPTAGTYTYALKTVSTVATGTMNFGETDGPVLTMIELAGRIGPTGSAGTNGTNGQGVPTGGTANQVLSKINSTDYNTQWSTVDANANYITNGAFDVAQRGTSIGVNGASGGAGTAYTLDQWVATSGATTAPGVTQVTISQQASTANMISGYDYPYYANFATILAVSGTVTSASYLSQRIEDVRTLAGQQVTLSFWAKISTGTNSNFVPVIEQNFGTGGSASVTNTGSAISLTTSWQRFTYTVTLGSMSGKTIGTNSYLDVRPLQLPAANFVTGLTVSIAGVKLEVGSTATSFARKQPSINAEQLDCYRYYYRMSGATALIPFGTYAYYTTTQAYGQVKFPVPMRVAPSASVSSVTALSVYAGGSSKTTTDILPQSLVVSKEMMEFRLTTAATTAGFAAFVRFPVNSTEYIEFTSEI